MKSANQIRLIVSVNNTNLILKEPDVYLCFFFFLSLVFPYAAILAFHVSLVLVS